MDKEEPSGPRTTAKERDTAPLDEKQGTSSSKQVRGNGAPSKPPVAIKLAGKEYRIRSDANEEWLQQVAGYVDQAMQNIRERTDTVDSLDVALLAALNLAREVLHLRGKVAQVDQSEESVSDDRLRDLIVQIELELPAVVSDH
jgi:cell division protein ZapA (FtsZ GTPase activity inhibitor)